MRLRFLLLLLAFMSVPIFLFRYFDAADQAGRDLLLQSVQDQGRLAATALAPRLLSLDRGDLPEVVPLVRALAGESLRIRLFYRPTDLTGVEGFFAVAAEPGVASDSPAEEHEDLVAAGILARLASSCDGAEQLTRSYGTEAGPVEVLTWLTPVAASAGCFVVLTSTAGSLGPSLVRPYWNAPEIGVAAAIYGLLVVVVLGTFVGLWRSLIGFARIARDIRPRGSATHSFARRSRVRELASVAAAFDAMVGRLHEAAEMIRRGAEEHAHALKAPVAVIAQAIEPLRRSGPLSDEVRQRVLALIERALVRLSLQIGAASRIDQAIAQSVDPPAERLDLSTIVADVAEDYRAAAAARRIELAADIEPGIAVLAGEELLEVVLENLLENALDFSPPEGAIRLRLRRGDGRAVLTVEDEGPGIEPARLETVFRRNYSDRPAPTELTPPGREATPAVPRQNAGLGLWIVRRNVQSIRGRVWAENRPRRGLRVTVELPIV